MQARTGTTSLVTLALLTAGEKPDSPVIRKAIEHLRRFGPDDSAQHLRDRPADHGLRGRRAGARPAPDRRQRELARSGPDQARPARPAGLLDLLRGPQRRRQLEHPVRASGPQRGRGGRRPRQARGLGPRPALLGEGPAQGRRLGLPRRRPALDLEHDLRGDLQPDHHRLEAVPGCRIPPGRPDPQLRPGRRQPATSSAGSTGSPPTSASARTSPWASSGSTTSSTAWSGPAGWRASASSASTTGTAWAPRSWSTPRTGWRASGGAHRKPPWSPPASRSCSWPRAAPRSWSTSSATAPRGDWNNDPDDVRNLVAVVSRDWKNLLTWQVVDPAVASVADLLQAPIVFLNGHKVPELQRPGQAEPPRLRRAGGLPLRRRLLLQPRSSTPASSSS